MFTVSVGALLIAALLVRKDNRAANYMFAVVIASALFRQVVVELKMSGDLDQPWIYRSTFPTMLLSAPLFYLYIRALTDAEFRLNRIHLWHLLPAAFGLTWYLLFWFFADAEYFHMSQPFLRERYARLVISDLVAAPYLFLSLQQIKTFSKKMKIYSSITIRRQLSWLTLLALSAILLKAVDLADTLTGPYAPLFSYIPRAISVVTLALGFFTLYYSQVFSRELASERRVANEKLNGTRLPDEVVYENAKKVKEYFTTARPYLNPSLRLADLATDLSMKPYLLSEVIRRGLGTNFYDLVNRHRIEMAKNILADPKANHLNLYGVALESGFNSKSVFNDVFKKGTHQTPSQYRRATHS